MIQSGFENKKARIEIIPLIDVVFLLLVFFIYAMLSMVNHKGIRVNLPFAASAAINKDEFVTISIDKSNHLFINGQQTTLQTLSLPSAQAKVYIQADQESDVGVAISVLDHLKQNGFSDISFETGESP